MMWDQLSVFPYSTIAVADEWQRLTVTEDDTDDYTDPPGTECWWTARAREAMPDAFDHGTPTA